MNHPIFRQKSLATLVDSLSFDPGYAISHGYIQNYRFSYKAQITLPS